MDILYVGTLPPHPGGSAVVGGQLLHGLAERGHRVRALAPITAEAAAAGDRFAVGHPAIEITRYRVPSFQVASHRPDAAFRALEAGGIGERLVPMLASDPPDVIVLGRENVVWYALDAALDRAIPTLLIVHSAAGGGAFTGRLTETEQADMVWRFRQVDRVIAVAHHLVGPYRVEGRRVEVVQNGVDVERFSPGPRPPELSRRLGIDPRHIVVAHISNLKDIKRPLDVLESAARCLSVRHDLVHVIVGDGEMRDAMLQRANALGIAERTRFVGWVEHDEVPVYLRLADLVLMPSETEGLALVYLETQASGRVLIASDVPAAREAVSDGLDGMLHPVGDVDAIAAAVLRAATDARLRATMGTNARRSAEARDSGRMVDRYEAILGELSSGRAAA
jgi:glycosyltransferase involved in cell wall biosynthesis